MTLRKMINEFYSSDSISKNSRREMVKRLIENLMPYSSIKLNDDYFLENPSFIEIPSILGGVVEIANSDATNPGRDCIGLKVRFSYLEGIDEGNLNQVRGYMKKPGLENKIPTRSDLFGLSSWQFLEWNEFH